MSSSTLTSPHHGDSAPALAEVTPRPSRAGWPQPVFWILAAVILCGLATLTMSLSERRTIGGTWIEAQGHSIQLRAADDPELLPYVGQTLVGISTDAKPPLPLGSDALYPTGRWDVYADQRLHTLDVQRQLKQLLRHPQVTVHFASGATQTVSPKPLGIQGLGLSYWILIGLAVLLLTIALRVLCRSPTRPNYVYMLLSSGFVMSLIMMACIATGDLTAPLQFAQWDYTIRSVSDLLTVTAMVQSLILHPVAMPHRRWMAVMCWVLAATPMVLLPWIEQWHWWITRTITGAIGALALWLAYRVHEESNHPLGMYFWRAGTPTLGVWILLNVITVATTHSGGTGASLALIGTVLWTVFFALYLSLLPFLARSRQIVREFSLLAGVTTLAAVLHLFSVSAFSIDALTALILTVLAALTVYTMVRKWLLDRSVGRRAASTERIFEQIYITLENAELLGGQPPKLADSLLRSVFNPQFTDAIERVHPRAHVSRDGAIMTVPLPPPFEGSDASTARSVRLHNAHQGRRLFTLEDARMADHVVDQLSHILAFQRARDQGRREERLRLAQDLHDDIGARLLTLMYKAPSAEMEEYIRHTLQDLKTLTRGLASGRHRLSNAVSEWKTDAAHRLEALRCELDWHNELDTDVELSVVQWSTLTRVLRELISNVISHSQATCVNVLLTLKNGTFRLQVTDDGIGQSPQTWSHGLGLGGIRKRIKQLCGHVEWTAQPQGGVQCTIQIDRFSPVDAD